MAVGSATLAFGVSPGNYYSTVNVTGLSGLTVDSYIEAFFEADTTGSNGSQDHIIANSLIKLTCEYLTSSSFRIHALMHEGGTAWGDFKVRYVTA